jgi:hypothetical protein
VADVIKHRGTVNPVSIVKSWILSFFWIPACAGMTICEFIPIKYKTGHTREGGYPDAKMTFYEFINLNVA